MAQDGRSLFRVSTPPLVREYRERGQGAAAPPDGAAGDGAAAWDLMRVATPPLVRDYRERAAGDGTRVLAAEDEDGELSSPSSLTACTASTSAFSKGALEHVADGFDLDGGAPGPGGARRRMMYFDTGVVASDMRDASQHGPTFKTQFTVTGQTRQVRARREGPPLGHRVTVNGHQVALFKYKGRCYAIDSTCCHQGGPLAEGDIEDLAQPRQSAGAPAKTASLPPDPCVACPWHGWRFKLETGECLNRPEYKQRVFPCDVVRGRVLVGFSDFAAEAFDTSAADF